MSGPGPNPEHRRSVLRAVVLWGLFGVLLLVAVWLSRSVQADVEQQLADQPLQAGALSVRLPVGWIVEREINPIRGVMMAAIDPEEPDRMLRIRLTQIRPTTDPQQLIQASFRGVAADPDLAGWEGELVDYPRPAEVGEQEGSIATVALFGPRGLVVYSTVVGAPVADQTGVFVEVRRLNDWSGEDTLLARAVAQTVQIDTTFP